MAAAKPVSFKDKFKASKIVIPEQKAPIDDSSFIVDAQGRFIVGNLSIDRTGLKRDSTTPDETVDRSSNMKLADIELLSILGRGNSGQVHCALHRPTGQVIALKAINIMDRDNRHQLLKEIRTLNDCDSPFLVKFLGAFYSDPAISIALELMDAGSLETVLEAAPRRRMPERIAAIVARQMVEGLAYLHRKHMLHRDIKLSNVCLSRRGEVKLTDFGISTQLQNSIAVCATFVGTYTYMSPERIIGKEYSYASDVWSLGLIVLESVMGEFPYPDNGVVIHLMKTVVEGPPEIPKDLSPDLRSFCEQCLRTNAAERASAADLLRHPFIAGLADPAKYQPELADWLKSVLKPEERASAPRR